jgi:hypothetical protein
MSTITRCLPSSLLLLFTACTTVASLRAQAPDASVTLPGDYRDLASCTMDRLERRSSFWAEASYRLLDRTDLRSASVLGVDPTNALPIVDLAFHQRGSEVLVEARDNHQMLGKKIGRLGLDTARQCAAP